MSARGPRKRPNTYRVVSRLPRVARPTDPQDLPQTVLALLRITTAVQMRAVLAVLGPLVEACDDGDFNRFMAQSVKAMLRSKGFSTEQLEEAMTMGTVVTEFPRGWDEVRQEGQVAVLTQLIARKFGQRTVEEVQQLLDEDPSGDRIAWATNAILDCDKAEDFLAGLRGD